MKNKHTMYDVIKPCRNCQHCSYSEKDETFLCDTINTRPLVKVNFVNPEDKCEMYVESSEEKHLAEKLAGYWDVPPANMWFGGKPFHITQAELMFDTKPIVRDFSQTLSTIGAKVTNTTDKDIQAGEVIEVII